MRRVAQAANFRHAVYGPSELFYGELYSSQEVDCRPTLARPGTRDPYSGCVGAYLEQYDLYDFLLFSLPDNDHYSHRHGPDATVTSIARADRYLEQLVEAAGGIGAVLRRPRRDPDGRPRADRGRPSASGSRTRCRRLACAAAQRPGARGRRAGGLPGRALGDGLRARRRRTARRALPAVLRAPARARGRRPAGLAGGRARPACGPRAASCGSRRDGACATPRRDAGTSRDARRRSRPSVATASGTSRAYPGRAAPAVGGARLRRRGGRAAVGRARLRVRGLGRRRPRRRRQPRLAAARRLARSARVPQLRSRT